MTLNSDVAICTESWLSSNDVNEAFSIEGYDCFRTDRVDDSGHGGVALWTKKKLHAEQVSLPASRIFEVCIVKLSHSPIIVAGVYLRPGVDATSFRNFCDDFVKSIDIVLNVHPFHSLVVAGDFNQYDRSFLISNLCLRNIVHGPTRGNSFLDQIFVDSSLQQIFNPSDVVIGAPIGSSDHDSVFACAKGHVKKRLITKHKLYDLRLSNILSFEQHFLSLDLNAFYDCKDVEQKCDIFYSYLIEALNVIPCHDVFLTSNDAPWMTPLIKFLINKRWQSYRTRDWVTYQSLKGKISEAIWRAKKSFFLKKSGSVKGLWSYVNMERGSKSISCSSLAPDHSSIGDFLNSFNDHFCRAMQTSEPFPDSLCSSDDGWLPQIDVIEVWQYLQHLRVTATGSDGIPTKLYKKAALVLAEPIHDLITDCIRQRIFPSVWKFADVCPVPKTRGTSMDDYRPISLLPIPAKLAEKFILNNLRNQMTTSLGRNQFGIRRHSSTSHAIIAVHDTMTKLADDTELGASVFVAFDFSKAFDKVDHHMLIRSVQRLQLPSGFVRLLINYLSERKQRVRVNGFTSDLKLVTSGVPQGSLLGPYLFGLFISSLQPRWSSTTMIKYVDDVSFVAPISKTCVVTDLTRIREEIENIGQWSTCNRLTLNSSKTTGLIHSSGQFKAIHGLESAIGDVRLKASLRFLGVILSDNLGWKDHVDFVSRKCAQRMYILRRLRSVTSDTQFQSIYCGIIRCLLEYACPAFVGLCIGDASKLHRIQKRCLKIKGIVADQDLSTRRISMAMSFFNSIRESDTFLAELIPPSLPSGRTSIPFCRTSLRRSSFFPAVSLLLSDVHVD